VKIKAIRTRLAQSAALVSMVLAAALPAFAQEQQKLVMTTDFGIYGLHAPLYLAREKGWYKEAGIDLTIQEGKGSNLNLSLLASGRVDVAIVAPISLAIARTKGLPGKMIGSFLPTNNHGLIFKKGAGYAKPADFRDKQIVFALGTMEGIVLDKFLEAGGMKTTDVKAVGVDPSAKVASVMSGKYDAAVAPIPYYAGLLAGKQDIDSLTFADFGFPIMFLSFTSTEKVIESRPQVLKAFMKVTSRAYHYVLEGPDSRLDEAVKAMLTALPQAGMNYQTAYNMFKSHTKFLSTPATAGKPIGTISQKDVEDSVATMRRIGVIPPGTDLKASDIYTTQFNP
jgi:NitT/TauT family transport system substrate-binding protein